MFDSPGRTRIPLQAGLIPPVAGLYQRILRKESPDPSFLDAFFQTHGIASCGALLAPDQAPRPWKAFGRFRELIIRVVVLSEASLDIGRGATVISAA